MKYWDVPGPSCLIILGLTGLVKVALRIWGVKTIQREDCKKSGMLKSEESSYVTPAQRQARTVKTNHANTWQTGNLSFLDWNKDNCYSMCLQYFKPRTCVQINLLEAFPPVYSILSQERNVRWIKLIWRMLIQSSGWACLAVSTNKSHVHNWPSLSFYQSVYDMMYPDCNIVSAGMLLVWMT